MSINLDPQATGWVDDGSESGIIKTKNNDIVIVPFSDEPLDESAGAILNAFYNGLSGIEESNGSVISLQIGVGSTNYVKKSFSFRGSVLGILRDAAKVPYTVVIDGIAYQAGYQVGKNNMPLRWENGNSFIDSRYLEVIVDDLPNTLHHCDIIIQGNASSQVSFKIFGLGLSKQAGYERPEEKVWYIGNVALPNTVTSIANLTTARIKSVSKFIFYNYSANAADVTVSYLGSNPIFISSVPAGKTVEWSFPTLLSFDASIYRVMCNTASAVNMSIIGRANI